MTMQTFKTSDFSLTSFAVSKGAVIAGMDRSDPRRVVFELEIDCSPEEMKSRFWDNSTVNVRDFVSAQAEVKKRLFSDAF